MLSLSANTMFSNAGYVPNVKRPAISVANPHGIVADDGTNIYSDSIEAPALTAAQSVYQLSPTSWIPTDGSGAALALTVNKANYTKTGKTCTVEFNVTYPTTASGKAAIIGGLPCSPAAGFATAPLLIGDATSAGIWAGHVYSNGIAIQSISGPAQTNATLGGHELFGTATYISE